MKKLCKCKHFNGIQNKTCEAGIDYQSLPRHPEKGGILLPCIPVFGTEFPSPYECDKREFPTQEEVDADEAYLQRRIGMLGTARKAIVEATGGKRGVVGKIKCPCCDSGELRYSVAGRNGHIHAACTSDACVSWME